MKTYLILFGLLFALVSCKSSKDTDLYPTIEEIIDAGFYVYVLPASFSESGNITTDYRIFSWNLHCDRAEPSREYSRMRIIYGIRGVDEHRFQINITPKDTITNHSVEAKSVTLRSPYIPTKLGEYYIAENGIIFVRFKDMFGMDTYVSSSFDIGETIAMINQLEYRGPDISSVGNPWEDICNK